MEIASIKGDTVLLLYHPGEAAANVGQQFTIMELPERQHGLVVQIISNESLEYAGLQQEMIQRILEQRVTETIVRLDHESGMGEIKSLKVAIAKIRKRVQQGEWSTWDGWIPTRNVEISEIAASDLLGNVLSDPRHALDSFALFNDTPVRFCGTRMNMVNVIAGVKGSGKSHLAKHLVLSMERMSVPCIVFDINGEYVELPNSQVIRWGDNFRPNLAEVGYEALETLVRALYPLTENSAAVFQNRLPNIFNAKRERNEQSSQPFTMDIPYLRQERWGGGNYVEDAIDNRLRVIHELSLFCLESQAEHPTNSFSRLYESACNGSPVIFDMRDLNTTLQSALVKSINKAIEGICTREARSRRGRFPFVFFEEAHFYISDAAIINTITRGRHIGIASVFVTNSPQKLPDTVFRQLDNLFLLSLTHKEDIRNVSKNSFTDEATIESFATRMPIHHALIMGNVTNRYPLILSIDPLPPNVPPTGETRSTWDRFNTRTETEGMQPL